LLAVLPLLRHQQPAGTAHPEMLPAAAGPEQHPSPGSPGAPALNGVDFTGLKPDQVSVATQILNETRCNCGCGMTLFECRSKDPNCSRSLNLAQGVVQDLKSGKDRATVQSNLTASLARLAAPAPAAPAPPPEDPDKVFKIDTTGSPYRGPKGASVVIVEFSDFQCPYCGKLQPLLKQVLEAYPKQVKLVFKQFPLSFHIHARPAALASMAAARQGKFWEMHDKIYENQASLGDAQGNNRFPEFAKAIGLDMAKYEKDLKDPALEQALVKDAKDGADAQVTGTPSLYVNGRKVYDRSFEGFKKMIEAGLGGTKTASAAK